MDISRNLYNKCKELIREPDKIQKCSYPPTGEIKTLFEWKWGNITRIPNTRSSTRLKWRFQLDAEKAELLNQLILKKSGFNILNGDEYSTGDRVENRPNNANEKTGSNASQDVILLNNAAGVIKLNQEICSLFNSINCAGLEVRHEMIKSIEHDALIICENFPPMYYLHQLNNNPFFSNALVIYRGDSQNGKRADEVCKFITYWSKSLPVSYFGALDPAGLRIAKDDFKVDGIILPSLADLTSLGENQLKDLATPDKYFPHLNGHTHVNPLLYPQPWRAHITLMNQHQLGWQQEPLLKEKIEWILLLC